MQFLTFREYFTNRFANFIDFCEYINAFINSFGNLFFQQILLILILLI